MFSFLTPPLGGWGASRLVTFFPLYISLLLVFKQLFFFNLISPKIVARILFLSVYTGLTDH